MQDRTTAGVSYVVGSSSSQHGVSPAQAPLPPTVIRPSLPLTKPDSAAAVAAAADRLVEMALHQASSSAIGILKRQCASEAMSLLLAISASHI